MVPAIHREVYKTTPEMAFNQDTMYGYNMAMWRSVRIVRVPPLVKKVHI